MADSILRLRVESQEYDSKLKQATQGLTRYVDECRKMGGTLEVVEKETLDYVRALGQMDTTSRTATGKLAEMKKTFVELSAQYKQMTDEEKASPFGKALAQSLDQLKGRIRESKTQLDDVNKSINGSGGLTGALDAVAGKFGLSIDQVTKFGGVVGVATTAVQVAKDAFFQSESGIDEWGRTVEGAKGAYSVFLDTLNNGNWSNFFQNLSAAIQGGRDLYDVFDRLGSIKSNNAAAIAITQKEIAELRLAKQQGENVDAKLKSATERLAALQKQSVSAGMAAGSQSAFQTIRNGVNSIGGAGVNDATIKYAVDKIMKGGQSEFDKYKYNYEILQQRGMVTRTQTINDSQGGTYERQYRVFDINALTKEQQKQYALAKAITEGETRIQEGIAAYAQSVSEGTASAREAFKGNRYALQGAGGGGGRSGGRSSSGGGSQVTSLADILLQSFNKSNGKIDANGLLEQPSAGGSSLFRLMQAQHDKELSKNSLDSRADFEEGWDRVKSLIENREDPNKEFKKQLAVMDTMAGNLGNIMSGINKMGIELPQGLTAIVEGTQSIISIITSIMTLVSIISSLTAIKSTPILGWLLAEGGIVGGSRGKHPIHAATGTVVPGSNYSGDMVPAMLNSGELVLNRAQQGNLASQLEGGGMNNLQLEAIVTGEQLRFVLNTNSRRRGMGEYVTSTNV